MRTNSMVLALLFGSANSVKLNNKNQMKAKTLEEEAPDSLHNPETAIAIGDEVLKEADTFAREHEGETVDMMREAEDAFEDALREAGVGETAIESLEDMGLQNEQVLEFAEELFEEGINQFEATVDADTLVTFEA